MLKDTDSQKATVVNVGVDGARRDEIEDRHRLATLTVTVDATNALLDPHRIPGEIIVHEKVTKLKIQTLAADLGRQQDINGIRVFLGQCEPGPKTGPFIVGNAAVNYA